MNKVLSKKKVRSLMKEKGIDTQKKLAKEMDISSSHLSKILSSDYNFIKKNIRELCNVLEVDIDDIVIDVKKVKDDDTETEAMKLFEAGDEYINTSKVIPKKDYYSVELFAGAGGLALGLEKSGFKNVALVENNEDACSTLRKNRPKWNVIESDIEDVVTDEIRNYFESKYKDQEIDLVSGGYPCQAFSYAGKKLGLEDTRGTLFYYFAETLKQLQPKVFVAENVRGLKSHDNGKTLKTMINAFEEVGYNVKYKVLNSWKYNVAQKRKRLFIVGVRKDIDIEYKYPEPYENRPVLKDVIKDVPDSDGVTYSDNKEEILKQVPPGGCWRDLPDEVAKDYMGKSYHSSGGRTGMARRLSWEEPSLTILCSPSQKQTERCHPEEVRPFTIRESARIQSFDDNWEFCGSTYSKYKQIGNAVPVNLAKEIGLSLVHILNKAE